MPARRTQRRVSGPVTTSRPAAAAAATTPSSIRPWALGCSSAPHCSAPNIASGTKPTRRATPGLASGPVAGASRGGEPGAPTRTACAGGHQATSAAARWPESSYAAHPATVKIARRPAIVPGTTRMRPPPGAWVSARGGRCGAPRAT